MAIKIIPKKSVVADKVPLAGDLTVGELAINLKDKKIFSKDELGNVFEFPTSGTVTVTGTQDEATMAMV